MKWFKHDSDARSDVRSKLLISKFGFEGYGIYWAILEFIADDIDEKKDPNFWGILPEIFTIEFLVTEFRIDENKLKNIFDFMAEIGLIDKQNWTENRIANKKIIRRTDEYTRKVCARQKQTPDKLRTNSGQTPKNIRLEESRVEVEKSTLEKSRVEKNFSDLPLQKKEKGEILSLVCAFHEKFPDHKRKYSTKGVEKCFNEFSQRIEDGWEPEEILKRIEDYSQPGLPAPWDIFKDPEEIEEDFYPYEKLN